MALALIVTLALSATSSVTDVPTRLIPFTEEGPTRGPIPPPPPRLVLSTEDVRTLRLEHARQAHIDDGLFTVGPKDPYRATALSAEATLLAVLFPPALAVAPSLGQAYAGNWTQVILTSTARTGFLMWIAIASIDFANTLNTAQTLPQVQQASTSMNIALIVGGASIFVLSMVDILTAGQAATNANRAWEDSVLGEPSPR